MNIEQYDYNTENFQDFCGKNNLTKAEAIIVLEKKLDELREGSQ